MGTNLRDLVIKKPVLLKDLRGKVLAIDAYNNLYQYLTTIRSADGSVLTSSQGKVTSHLIGLFNRTSALMEQGVKLVFVFDGKPPEIKRKTWEKRAEIKQEASLKLKAAEEAGDIKSMHKFAARTAHLNSEMIADAKSVITLLGLPIVQAPSEGEAQTAYMVKKGDAFASVSQDYDNLIFGCPCLIKNLSIAGKRKKAGKLAYETVQPEMIVLSEVLENLTITLDQLIVVAILVGTDYNPGGVKGIGPKTAVKLVKEHGGNFERLFGQIEWSHQYPDLPWKFIFDLIKNIPVTDDYTLEWKPADDKQLLQLLVEDYDFSRERVAAKLEALQEEQGRLKQKGLSSFW